LFQLMPRCSTCALAPVNENTSISTTSSAVSPSVRLTTSAVIGTGPAPRRDVRAADSDSVSCGGSVVGVAVRVGVSVAVGCGVGVFVLVGAVVGVNVGASVGVALGTAVGVALAVRVAVAVTDGVGDGVGVSVLVGVAVGVGSTVAPIQYRRAAEVQDTEESAWIILNPVSLKFPTVVAPRLLDQCSGLTPACPQNWAGTVEARSPSCVEPV